MMPANMQDQQIEDLNLYLPEEELQRIKSRIIADYTSAIGQHETRMRRWQEYEKQLRQFVESPEYGQEDVSNYQVPLLAWILYAWVADMVEKLYGDDAEIIAKPTEPMDKAKAELASEFLTWAFFSDMKAKPAVLEWLMAAGLRGRAHAYMPWRDDTYVCRDEQGQLYRKVCKSGPHLTNIHPDDLIVPNERHAKTIHDFSFVIQREYFTPQDLLDGMRDGVYFDVASDEEPEKFLQLVQAAKMPINTQRIAPQGPTVREVQSEQQGVNADYPTSGGVELLEAWRWYGRLRLPVAVEGTGVNLDGIEREYDQTDVRVTFIPAIGRIISVVDLIDIYPDRPRRRPIEEIATKLDGTYWCPGLGQDLKFSGEELTAFHNLMTQAAQYQAAPAGVYVPASGFEPKKLRLAPGEYAPVVDINGARQLENRADLQGCIAMFQMLMSYVERQRGISDQTMGRAPDRPNAPRTATGQALIEQGGNKRLNLDVEVIREHLAVLLDRVWELYAMFGNKPDPNTGQPLPLMFRVTNKELAPEGFAAMTKQDFARFDFDLQFATSYYNREAEKQRAMEVYGSMAANPLFASNPLALWKLTADLWKALGKGDLAQILPPPPDPMLMMGGGMPGMGGDPAALLAGGGGGNPDLERADRIVQGITGEGLGANG